MKRQIAFLLVLLSIVTLFGCGTHPVLKIADMEYTYEKEGFGGDFIIKIHNDGSFYYYEGFLSSYIGRGSWSVSGDILTMKDADLAIVNHFRIGGDRLIFIEENSTNFLYLQVADGDAFIGKPLVADP